MVFKFWNIKYEFFSLIDRDFDLVEIGRKLVIDD